MAFPCQTCNTISVRLDDTNYPTWVFQMQHHLRGHGLLKYVDGSHPCPPQFHISGDSSLVSDNTGAYEKWLEQDSLLIFMITTTLSAEALTWVIGCQTSMEVWLTLKQRYAIVSEPHIMKLKAALQNIQKGSDSIDKYLLRFKYMRDRLAVAGIEMNDQDVRFLILAGLPSEYGHTRQIIRGQKAITMEEVRSLLLSAEFEIELEHKALSLSPLTTMVAQGGMPTEDLVLNQGMQWNDSTGMPFSYNCHAQSFNDNFGMPAMTNGVTHVNAYNSSPVSVITQVGFTPPSTVMEANIGFVNSYNNALMNNSGLHYSSMPMLSASNCMVNNTQYSSMMSHASSVSQNGGGSHMPYSGGMQQHNFNTRTSYSHPQENLSFEMSGEPSKDAAVKDGKAHVLVCSENLFAMEGKPAELVSYEHDVKVPFSGNCKNYGSFLCQSVKVVSRDDDENFVGCVQPCTTVEEFERIPIGDKKIKSLSASQHTIAPDMKIGGSHRTDGKIKQVSTFSLQHGSTSMPAGSFGPKHDLSQKFGDPFGNFNEESYNNFSEHNNSSSYFQFPNNKVLNYNNKNNGRVEVFSQQQNGGLQQNNNPEQLGAFTELGVVPPTTNMTQSQHNGSSSTVECEVQAAFPTLNSFKLLNRHLMTCRQACVSTNSWQSLPLIPPG